MNIQQIEAALSIPDTWLRCQRVLDEVQPVLRLLMDEFKSKYVVQAPELLDYYVHTYEVTLRTTMNDARNPKYAEKKQGTDIGKKAFVELIDKKYFQTEYGVLTLELNGLERKLKIVLSSSFYPFWEAVRTQAGMNELAGVISTLPDEVCIQVSDKDMSSLTKPELVPYIQKSVSEKRKPWIYFGTQLDFDQIPSIPELVDRIWNTWTQLGTLREYIRQEAASHALSLKMLESFNTHQDDIAIMLYGRSYTVKFDEVTDIKSNHRRQKYGIYDKGQLLVDGSMESYMRVPHESLGVFVNGHGNLFTNLRTLHGEGRVEWSITKGFRYHMKDDMNINKLFQIQAIEALKIHDFQLDGSSFYVGTWDNEGMNFVDPIAEVKKRLITAAALFADCTGVINLPRDDEQITGPTDDGKDGEEQGVEEMFEHNFNLSAILQTVHESPFTYDDSIIRDFHLNLISLEDKHFVILNGISGTGKTKLCMLYANAVYGKSLDFANPYLKVIPVRPDWTDSTSLFGYYSALEKRYVRTPFLNAVLQAIQEGKPMFIVLDEMNLARVEYYLSDYLSAIESRQPIRLHSEDHIQDVPQELQIPHNLYVIGTINVDETTHGISDKVLDRAFVMTLSDVDVEQFWGTMAPKYKVALQSEWVLMTWLHEQLCEYDLHFGYRTMNEMIRKLYANAQLDPDIRMEPSDAVDRVIAEKVLPKIRGDERIAPLLEKMINWTKSSFGDKSESFRHLARMKGELDRYGATQFWR